MSRLLLGVAESETGRRAGPALRDRQREARWTTWRRNELRSKRGA